ncbi:MAG: succinate--CoA ligase subunit alpha, partial [Chloroflexi bacterium]|nr:succinate--CoA ligase subunit alpha [Chloroflexota bacterium]
MSILIDQKTKVIVQGISGREGEFHTRQMLEYGTKIVGGTRPGRGGEKMQFQISRNGSAETILVPIFDTMAEAVAATNANASVIYVPGRGAADAILEAA